MWSVQYLRGERHQRSWNNAIAEHRKGGGKSVSDMNVSFCNGLGQQTSEQCRRSSSSPEGWCSPPRGRCWRPFHRPRATPDPQRAVCGSACTRPRRAGTGPRDRTLHTTEGSDREHERFTLHCMSRHQIDLFIFDCVYIVSRGEHPVMLWLKHTAKPTSDGRYILWHYR